MNLSYVERFFSLDGRKAVVTGAGSGIGQATAIALANFGAEVVLLGRNAARLSKTAVEIAAIGGKSSSHIVDISDQEQVDSFFAEYVKQYQKLDIFIANAGHNLRFDILDTTEEVFDDLIGTNFKGTWRCLKYAGRIMRQQRSGSIVVVTSYNGMNPVPSQAVYSATKAALISLTESLAGTLAPYGVRVNGCAPGVILTNINRHIFEDESVRSDKLEKIPLGVFGEPVQVANVIAAMVSDACRFMTGTTVLVDGGERLRDAMKVP